jgi:hypothetical protein
MPVVGPGGPATGTLERFEEFAAGRFDALADMD